MHVAGTTRPTGDDTAPSSPRNEPSRWLPPLSIDAEKGTGTSETGMKRRPSQPSPMHRMPSASSESSKVSQNSSLVYDPEPVTASGFTTTKPVREYNGGMRRKSATEHDDEIKLLVRNASGGATNVRKTLQQVSRQHTVPLFTHTCVAHMCGTHVCDVCGTHVCDVCGTHAFNVWP